MYIFLHFAVLIICNIFLLCALFFVCLPDDQDVTDHSFYLYLFFLIYMLKCRYFYYIFLLYLQFKIYIISLNRIYYYLSILLCYLCNFVISILSWIYICVFVHFVAISMFNVCLCHIHCLCIMSCLVKPE